MDYTICTDCGRTFYSSSWKNCILCWGDPLRQDDKGYLYLDQEVSLTLPDIRNRKLNLE